jgi:hypothetical protein
MKFHFPATFLLIAIAIGCNDETSKNTSQDSESKLKAADIVKNYEEKFELLTPAPHKTNQQTATMCRSITAPPPTGSEGPHAYHALKILTNETAKATLENQTYPFRVNSVIVKEKLKDGNVTGVGGMIKRNTGFDPDHGNWEYFYKELDSDIESGKIASCIECHQKAADTDHVFATWR